MKRASMLNVQAERALEGLNHDRVRTLGSVGAFVSLSTLAMIAAISNLTPPSRQLVGAALVTALIVLLSVSLVNRTGGWRLEIADRTFRPPRRPAGSGSLLRGDPIPFEAVNAIALIERGSRSEAVVDLSGPWIVTHFWAQSEERRTMVWEIARRAGRPLLTNWEDFMAYPIETRNMVVPTTEKQPHGLDKGPREVAPLVFVLKPKALQKRLFLQERSLEPGQAGIVVTDTGLEAFLPGGRRIRVTRENLRRVIANRSWTSAECYARDGLPARHFALMMKCYSESERNRLHESLGLLGPVLKPKDLVFLRDDLRIEQFFALGS